MAPCEKSVDDYCRLCAVEAKNGVVIYSSEGVNLCLEEKIIQCLRIELSKNDMLPKKVCKACRARLEDYHRFAERANRVQHTLELLIQMKNSLPVDPSVADKENEDDISVSVKSDPGVNIKNDPEDIEIKDELLELPLDVTLEADGDIHIEPKSNSTDDDQSISDIPPSPVRDSKRIPSERPVRLPRRRKMLQPKKSSHGQPVGMRHRGRPRRSLLRPPNSEGETEDEEKAEKLEEDGDEDADYLERIDQDSYDELDVFKGFYGSQHRHKDGSVGTPCRKKRKHQPIMTDVKNSVKMQEFSLYKENKSNVPGM